MTGEAFTPEEIERANRYHRPRYAVQAVDGVLSLALLAGLAFTPAGHALFGLVDGLAWWAAAPLFTVMVVAASFLLGLPLSFWSGYVREKRWGFSTQTVGGWLADRGKGLAVGLVLSGLVMTGLVGSGKALHDEWWLAAAPAGAVLVLVISFVAPVLLEPLFNRFRPLEDAGLAADLRSLSERAGVPVRDVLVADASRRTRKENAYVSGLGRTRRVVLYDTLLAREPGQIRLVTAHELGHRRLRHVAAFTVLGMVGVIGAALMVRALQQVPGVLSAAGAKGVGDPRIVPFILLVGAVLQLLALPFQTALSRRLEAAADRFSLDLTEDPAVFERSHRALALANLSDLDPPRPVYLLLFTHPTPPARIAMARRWAETQPAATTGPERSTPGTGR